MSTSEHEGDRAARAGRNQALFREINERVRDLNDTFTAITPVGEWICECANDTCVEQVEMTLDEYEAVRASGTHFFVSPDDAHVWPDVERVRMRNDRYWIVEKVGDSGELAERADPRNGGTLPPDT